MQKQSSLGLFFIGPKASFSAIEQIANVATMAPDQQQTHYQQSEAHGLKTK
jgi:hypothetical protein